MQKPFKKTDTSECITASITRPHGKVVHTAHMIGKYLIPLQVKNTCNLGKPNKQPRERWTKEMDR